MSKKFKIIITDGYALSREDLNWQAFEALGDVTFYGYTAPSELINRIKNADVIIVNKTVLTAETIADLPNLKYIGMTATGYNNVDVKAAAARNIPVCNVADYGSKSVAQHVFALILALTNQVAAHNTAVQAGEWGAQPHFCITKTPLIELSGKTLGIYGFSGIGQEVAKIGRAFGMKIIVHRRNTEGGNPRGIRYVSLDELFQNSDILTLNASMNAENQGFINSKTLALMKPSALLINTARGGLIVENDLKQALENGIIKGAGLDVLSVEPPKEGSVLIGVKNCIITPHNAWASFEARQRLMTAALNNLKNFLKGSPTNVVNL